MSGDITRYAYSSVDTVFNINTPSSSLRIADEFAVGMSYRINNKWALGVDYIQQNWRGDMFPDAATWSNFEAVPSRQYRAGAYYEQSYVKVNGHQVNAFGITFGASFPIFRWYNAVSVAVDIGQRGSLKYNQVRERYVNFIVNINLHDIWFVKYRYD